MRKQIYITEFWKTTTFTFTNHDELQLSYFRFGKTWPFPSLIPQWIGNCAKDRWKIISVQNILEKIEKLTN